MLNSLQNKILLSFKFIFLLSFSMLLTSCSSDESMSGINEEEENSVIPESAPITPCENGMAGIFPCEDYDLLSSISISKFSANSGNDSWGWTDQESGKEYAIIGLDNGTAFVDISIPTEPVYLGILKNQIPGTLHSDIKTYLHYAFIVSEAEGHGMKVFDLRKLRDVSNTPTTFQEDASYNEFEHAHNLNINEATGFAYIVGTETFDGGPHIVNIQDPLNPTFAGGYALAGYSHDAQVVTYIGPDIDYIGKELFIGSNENAVVMVDFTDKSNPVKISEISYPNVGYTHQGWLTEDQKYFILGDELDELQTGNNTRTIILDATNLDNPTVHMSYSGSLAAIDHNGYVNGDMFYLANYTGGMRVLDISDIENKNIREVGYFDTFPLNNATTFNGAWNVHPFFQSGSILISDIDNGLFLVRKKR